MGAMASQITRLTIAQIKVLRHHWSLAFEGGIHRSPVKYPHKWSVTRKMLPFDDVIMNKTEDIKAPHHSTFYGNLGVTLEWLSIMCI